jgi:hypothetical protein
VSDRPKSSAEAWSEWLREASVLIAVFGGIIDPFFDGGPSVRPGSLPPYLADQATGKIGALPWVLMVLVLAGGAQVLGLAIERRR